MKFRKISYFILILIVFASFGYAQTQATVLFEVIKFGGPDGVKGFIKSGDPLHIEVLVTIPGQAVVKEQVHLETDEGFEFFQECVKQTDVYKCTYKESSAIPDKYTVSVYLYQDRLKEKASALYSEEINLQVDSVQPKITNFELSETFTKDGRVKINYKAEDNEATCSGIKEVEFKANGNIVQKRKGSLGRCTLSELFEYSHATNLEFEAVELCISATDFLNRKSNVLCKEFSVDSHAPVIKSARVTDKKGFHLTHLRSGEKEREADLLINVLPDTVNEVSDLDESLLFADISSANPSERERGFDEKIDDETFLWNVKIKDPVNCNIIVKAQDKLGNKAQQSFPCKLLVDDSGPELIEVSAQGKTEDDALIFGVEAPITAIFKDLDSEGNSGIGMDDDTTKANFAQLGLGTVKADFCEKTKNNEWTCTWKVNPAIVSGTYSISFDKSLISDALGNPLKESVRKDVIFDKDPPKVLALEQKIIAGEVALKDVIFGQSQLRYIVNATPDVVSGVANFSQLGGGEVKGFCNSLEENKVQCTFDGVVQKSGPYDFTVKITVFDNAGNKATTEVKGKVYELADESKNYWRSAMKCTPKLIDRSLASLIPHTTYCHIKLKPLDAEDKIQPLSVVLSDWPNNCRGDIEGNIADIQVIHSPESRDAYLQVFLYQQEIELNSLNIECDVNVFTLKDDKAVRVPEIESVNASVGFHNLPHGELYGSMNNEIKRAIKDSEKMEGVLDNFNTLLNYAENTCKIKTTITNTISALFIVTDLLGITEDALIVFDWIPFVKVTRNAIYQARQTSCHAKEGLNQAYQVKIFEFLDRFCLIANCQLAQGGKDSFGVEGIIGGQAPWCQALESKLGSVEVFGQQTLRDLDILKTSGEYTAGSIEDAEKGLIELQDVQKEHKEPLRLLNVQDSIIWSTSCLCLPGIVKNLEKYRQIKCRYAQCLIEDVKEYGISIAECKDEKQYLSCAYWTGEIWEAMPFSRILDKYSGFLTEILTDPGALISAVIGNYCETVCPQQPSRGYTVCAAARTLSTIGEAVQSFTQISKMKSFSSLPGEPNFCEQLDKVKGGVK